MTLYIDIMVHTFIILGNGASSFYLTADIVYKITDISRGYYIAGVAFTWWFNKN